MIAFQVSAVFGQDADALAGNIQATVNWDAVVAQQVQAVGFFRIVETVNHDGFLAAFDHLAHLVGGVFFHQGQAFSKADAIAAE